MAICFALLASAHANEAPPSQAPSLIPFDAEPEVVAEGFKFTEGPALAPDGSIYFSDIPNNRIHRYDPKTGQTTVFREDSGGANGLAFMNDQLVVCEGKRRRVAGYDLEHHEPAWIVARWDGKRFNSPNDLAVSALLNEDGVWTRTVLFTDPRYGNRDDMELEHESIYFALSTNQAESDPEKLAAEATLAFESTHLAKLNLELERPNGIAVCEQTFRLYVADNQARKIFTTPQALHEGNDKEEFADVSDLGGPDGMTVDRAGRLYVAIFGKGILVLAPDGERLGFIDTGPRTSNCAFGADGQTLYITSDGKLKRIRLNTDALQADDHGRDGE